MKREDRKEGDTTLRKDAYLETLRQRQTMYVCETEDRKKAWNRREEKRDAGEAEEDPPQNPPEALCSLPL